MEASRIVSREEWIAERRKLLAREKAHMRAGDEIAAARRALPRVRIDKPYAFETEQGPKTLAGLFDGRSQLIVYHFMFAPGWEAGCVGCSFLADHIDAANLHLAHHDVTLLAVSRAPLAELLPYRRRMGWRFDWVSSHPSDFNADFQVSVSEADRAAGQRLYNFERTALGDGSGEEPGISVFLRDGGGEVFHTYSAYARGGDILIGAHNFLDLTPKGRNEDGIMDWVRRHDEYAGGQEEDRRARA